MAAPLVDDDDDVEGALVDVDVDVLDGAEEDEADGAVDVTGVVVDGGGAANGVDGAVLLLPPVNTTTIASKAASANVRSVPASNATWPLLIRDRLAGGGAAR